MILALLSTLVLFASTETSTQALGRVFGDVPFILKADKIIVERTVLRAEGNVELSRSGVEVRAHSLILDRSTKRATLESAVTVREGGAVVSCRKMEMTLPELTGAIDMATLVVRDTPEGRAEIIIAADRIERSGKRTYELDSGSFTPCDCSVDGQDPSEATPAWRIRAASADLDLDGGVFLTWPVFYVFDVPVLGLPIFYVPLGDRRSGLLFPRILGGAVTGVRVAEPIYFVLGRSFDLTLEPGVMSSRGYSLGGEFRYADGDGRVGTLRASLLNDEGAVTNRVWSWDRPEPLLRFAITGGGESSWGAHHLGYELGLFGDPAWSSELSEGYSSRQVEEGLSRLTYARTGRVRVAVGLGLQQDLRSYRLPLNPGEERREVSLLSARRPGPGDEPLRLLELRVDAPADPLWSTDSSWLDATVVGGARLSATGFVAPSPGAPRYVRADFRPSVQLPTRWGDVLSLEPSLALRLTGWSGRLNRESQSASRMGVIESLRAAASLDRRFEWGLHRNRLVVEQRALPWIEGGPNPEDCERSPDGTRCAADATFDREDETDTLGVMHQARISLLSEWVGNDGAQWAWLGLDGGYDFGMGTVEGLGMGPWTLSAGLALPGHDLLFARIRGSAEWNVETAQLDALDARIDAGWTGVIATSFSVSKRGDAVPRSHRVAPEELTISRTRRDDYVRPEAFRAEVVSGNLDLERWVPSFGATASLGLSPVSWASLQFSAIFDFEAQDSAVPTSLEEALGPTVKNLVGRLRLEPPCECAEVGVTVDLARDREGPDFSFFLELARLGEVRG